MAIDINYIKHGDFSFDDEKVEEIAKNLEVVNKKQGFLGRFTSPTARINGDQIIKRKQVLLDPVAVADLNEGDEPRQDSIKVVTFSEATRSFGSFIPFGRHAVKRNRDDITDMCRRQLSHSRLYDAEMVRFIAFDSTTYSADATYESSQFNWWATLTNLGIRLDKNKTKGDYIFLCTPEIAADIAREAKASGTLLQGTADGERLTKEGYIGDYCGFHVVKNHEPYMYKNVSGTRYQLAFAMGKTEDGGWPIVDTGMGIDPKGEVIVKDLGSSGVLDPTNEVGSIASRLDYVGAFCEHPENIIRIVNVTTGSGGRLAEVAGDLPEGYEIQANAQTHVGAGRDNASLQKIITGGGSFMQKFAAIKDADGTALTIASVTLKKGKTQGSGDNVSATDGAYRLVGGQWYNYSYTVTGYKVKGGASNSAPATGVFYADPQIPVIANLFVANA